MSTAVHPDVMDSALSLLSANTHVIVALSAPPATYADAAPGSALVQASMTGSDFTIDNALNGRTLLIASKTTTADQSGTAAAVALLDTTNERILFSAAIPTAQVTGGDVVHFMAWSITLAATV